MTAYLIKKSNLSVVGSFHQPEFTLLSSEFSFCSSVIAFLSGFFEVQSSDIRIVRDTNPISNSNITFNLGPLNGAAEFHVDRTVLYLFKLDTLTVKDMTGIWSGIMNVAHNENDDNFYQSFFIQLDYHAMLKDVDPDTFIKQYVTSSLDFLDPIIGTSITYYFGQEGPRSHSSLTLDLSNEYSDCILGGCRICCPLPVPSMWFRLARQQNRVLDFDSARIYSVSGKDAFV